MMDLEMNAFQVVDFSHLRQVDDTAQLVEGMEQFCRYFQLFLTVAILNQFDVPLCHVSCPLI